MVSVFSGSAIAAENSAPIELGKGTNLAHWLSQTNRSGNDRRDFIGEADIARIARLGFDHIRLPIDEEQMWDDDGNRDEDAFAIMNNAIRWSLENDMPVVIDLHVLRSHHFNASEKPLWTEAAAQDRFVALWQDLSAALHEYPNDMVVYELLNEPVADDAEDWNNLVAKAFAAIRELEPGRTIIIGSNHWQSADTFDELRVPDDDNIILSFHFYEPFLLTHYQTSWTFLKDYSGPVHYPGEIVTQEEFDALPAKQQEIAAGWTGKTFNKQVLQSMMAKPLQLSKTLGLPLYCGEYGVFGKAPADDRLRWYRDMLQIFAEENISSANWNYKSNDFGLVGNDGEYIEAIKSVLTGE